VRVLHVVATFQRRGGEVFASDLVRALGPAGIDQQVAVLHGGGPAGTNFDAPVVVLARDGSDGMGLSVSIVTALRRLARGWRPDVIQAHGGEPLKYSALARAAQPIVYRRIGFADPRVRSGPRRWAHGRLMRRAARVVAVSDAVRDEVVATFGVAFSRALTIPNAVDPARLKPGEPGAVVRRGLGVGPEAPVVSVLGALSEEKDPLGHLDIARRVIGGRPDTVVLFAGEGPLRPVLKDAASDLSTSVRVLGPRSDVAELLAATDVVLLTSRTEGMPGCLIEAAVAGVPVVAWARPGVDEVVRHGETGLLVEPGDRSAAAEAVTILLGDPATRRRLGAAASRWGHERFGIAAVAPRYVDVYRATAPQSSREEAAR
jgi:glycosyltransferase involved in cell wall biosynthesis